MHYVILRDDDTHALTPSACLERLYRPLLDRGLPVTLAVIPEVRTDVRLPNGQPEGFLAAGRPSTRALVPLAESHELLNYLHNEPGFHVAQHGCHHDRFEFGITDHAELARRLDRGTRRLREAGIDRPLAFVAPYDRLSRAAYLEVAERFEVISTGWFEARRTPVRWWTAFAQKKFSGQPHWRAGGTTLLGHPGCLLSYHRPYSDMLDSVRRTVEGNHLTVLVTHWWEYFRDGVADEEFIATLHEVGVWLASQPGVCVTTFDRVASGDVPLTSMAWEFRDSVARPAPPVAS